MRSTEFAATARYMVLTNGMDAKLTGNVFAGS